MKQLSTIKCDKVYNITGKYILLVGIILLMTVLPTQVQAQLSHTVNDIDSLERRLDLPALTEIEIYETYQALVNAYLHTDCEKSLEYIQKGLVLAEKFKNHFYFCELYFNAGMIHFNLNQMDSARYYYEKALAMHPLAVKQGLASQSDLDYFLVRTLVSFATLYYPSGQYDLMLDYYYKALEMAEKVNLPADAAYISMSIADIYKIISNTSQAEVYYLKGEKLYRELSDSLGIARITYKLSGNYVLQENYPKALAYGEEAYRILSAMSYVRAVDFYASVKSLSDAWFKLEDYDKALKYALMTVEYARQSNRQDYVAASFTGLSQIYLKQGNFRDAEETAFKAFAIDSTKMQVNSVLYQIIAESNIGLKNSAKAVEYFHKTIDTKNAYANQNFQASISEMEVKYETEKKEMRILSLEAEKRLMTSLSIAGSGLLLLGLLALFFLWRWTLQKRRLAEQQQELAETHIRQLEQEKQLVATQAVFDGEVQERSRLARDLHDGMGGKLTAMKIRLHELKRNSGINETNEKQFKVMMDMLDDSVQEMRRVSHNMMPDTLSRAGLKPALDDFCSSMSSLIVFSYYGDESRLDLKLETLIYRCIHELVNNALKYASASYIMVQIIQEEDSIAFTVQDNGCGFDPAAGTKGIGLKNVRSRIASVGGDIQIDSKAGVGTEINVELKIENSG